MSIDFQNGIICGLTLKGLLRTSEGDYQAISDALARKMYYPDTIDLQGILNCLATIAPAPIIQLKLSDKIQTSTNIHDVLGDIWVSENSSFLEVADSINVSPNITDSKPTLTKVQIG